MTVILVAHNASLEWRKSMRLPLQYWQSVTDHPASFHGLGQAAPVRITPPALVVVVDLSECSRSPEAEAHSNIGRTLQLQDQEIALAIDAVSHVGASDCESSA
eukprot:scpid101166/ scgid33907/ 